MRAKATNSVPHTDRELLRIVGRVAHRVSPEDPQALSQPQFDRHIAEHRHLFAGVPTARQIYARLNPKDRKSVSWTAIVRAGCGDEQSITQTLVVGARATSIPLGDRLVFFALRLVAQHLGWTTFGPDRYDAARDKLLDDADAVRRRALAPLLPTSNQIATTAGGWEAAMRLAGLDADDTPALRAQPRTPRRADSVSVPDAISLYVEYQGHLPSRGDLQWFRGVGGFVMASETGRPWAEFVASFRADWQARGRWAPPGLDRHRKRQPLPEGGIPGVARRELITIEECVEGVATYWENLPPRVEPTQKRYGAWAVGTPHPAPSMFQQFGGFAHIRELARERRPQPATAPSGQWP